MSHDLLVEIGTEELPPKSLNSLRVAFADELAQRLSAANLKFSERSAFATPRRLAVVIEQLEDCQPDEQIDVLGPTVSAAFDDKGNATSAAQGFAKRCGVAVDELQRKQTDKGERLAFTEHKTGRATTKMLPELIEASLRALPIDRWMRWGQSRTEFVRPLHWVICLFGDEVVTGSILGLQPGRSTRGHRFHANRALDIPSPDTYLSVLREQGKVLADYDERRAAIESGVVAAAETLKGRAKITPDLLDEVTALVEWPVVLAGSFEEEFLEVPQEALISSMQGHQKYFPLFNSKDELLPGFVFVSNIESTAPQGVIEGNERVIRPRLADARFFYQVDRKKPLEEFRSDLKHILFQRQLGSLLEKSDRIAELAAWIAEQINADAKVARRAGFLSKCDLASDMVGEFDELQGTMGRYYALSSDEATEVAVAIGEHYLPRHAKDNLPVSDAGLCVALADRLDTLTGIFGIGQSPTGSKDPFGLRRASLAVLRLILENQLRLPLRLMIRQAAKAHTNLSLNLKEVETTVFKYLVDRLPAWFQDRSIDIEPVRSVLALNLDDLTDMQSRIEAVSEFSKSPESQALAAANKRVSNLLKQANDQIALPKKSLLKEDAEIGLYKKLQATSSTLQPVLQQGAYTQAMKHLAELRSDVDRVFDEVMILVEDSSLRANRLALLSQLRDLFLLVADISELPSESR